MSDKPSKNPNFLEKAVHFFPALGEAFKKAREAKDTNFLDRIGIFFSSFKEEMDKVEEDKDEATKEAKEGVGGAVDKTLDETRAAAGLKENMEKGDKDFYDEVLAMAHTSYRGLEESHKSDFDAAFEQLDKAMKGEPMKTLSIEQSSALGAVGLGLILKLKEKYPEKAEFQGALEKLDKISENSNYPLKKLLSRSVLGVFKINVDVMSEGLSMLGSLVGGEKSPIMRLLDKFGMDEGEAKVLAKLKNSPIEEEVVDTMKKHIFPNTDKEKVGLVAKKISEILKNRPESLPLDAIAELAFNIDNADLKRLIEILGGKKITNV